MNEHIELPKSKILKKHGVLFSFLNADHFPRGPLESQNGRPNGIKNDTAQHSTSARYLQRSEVARRKIIKNFGNYIAYWICPKSHKIHLKMQLLKTPFSQKHKF